MILPMCARMYGRVDKKSIMLNIPATTLIIILKVKSKVSIWVRGTAAKVTSNKSRCLLNAHFMKPRLTTRIFALHFQEYWKYREWIISNRPGEMRWKPPKIRTTHPSDERWPWAPTSAPCAADECCREDLHFLRRFHHHELMRVDVISKIAVRIESVIDKFIDDVKVKCFTLILQSPKNAPGKLAMRTSTAFVFKLNRRILARPSSAI